MYKIKSWDEIHPGDSVELTRTITRADQILYGAAAGDFGPVHFDDEYARKTRFGRPIASGIMLTGLFTSILTSHLVGIVPVSIEDTFRFTGPVFFGDTILFRVSVEDKDAETRIIRWVGSALNESKVEVMAASALMKYPRRAIQA